MIKKVLIALGLVSMTLSATACNTVRGAAADMKDVADEVDDEI